MPEDKTEPTPAEWKVLHAVWEGSKLSAMEVVERVAEDSDWSVSTVKTLLARLVRKGYLRTKRVGTSYRREGRGDGRVSIETLNELAIDRLTRPWSGGIAARLAWVQLRTRALVRRAVPAPRPLRAVVRRLARNAGLRGDVRVVLSDAVHSQASILQPGSRVASRTRGLTPPCPWHECRTGLHRTAAESQALRLATIGASRPLALDDQPTRPRLRRIHALPACPRFRRTCRHRPLRGLHGPAGTQLPPAVQRR